MSQTRILVTGGAGYVGSHTCKALAQAGYEPVVIDNLSRGFAKAVQFGPLIEADIRDSEKLTAAIRQYQPVAAIHFAAFAYVGESVQHPDLYHQNNVCATAALLETLREHDLNRLVFSSTCAVYGESANAPVVETDLCQPINPYGASKLFIERMLADYDTAYAMKSVVLRYFNAAGADPEGDLGENHDPEPHIIPVCLQAAAGQRQAFQINGCDYATPDGTCIRDYIHVTDLARAHIMALEHLLKTDCSDTFNLGNGSGFSVRQIANTCQEISGVNFPIQEGPRRPGDPATLVANADKVFKAWGWQPEIPEIETMVAHAWRWLKRQKA